MEKRINEFQLKVLEYEIDVFPDIIPIALRKMRMRTIAQISQENFDRFFKALRIAKLNKYRNSNGSSGNK